MQFAYFGAVAIMFVVWVVLFARRKDLRRKMLIMSLLAAPFGLFDFWAVPLYWEPQTLFDLPIGIEGILYSFCLGGLSSVIYSHVTGKTPERLKTYKKSASLIVFAVTLIVLATLAIMRFANPAVILYIALLSGLLVGLYYRKDLRSGVVVGALCFGMLYFLILKVWITIFPGAVAWFHFQGLPQLFVFGIPLWELVFGTIFAAYWGNVYELLLGYKRVDLKSKHVGKRTS